MRGAKRWRQVPAHDGHDENHDQNAIQHPAVEESLASNV